MKIKKTNEPVTAVRISQYPNDGIPEFLLVGRSNVGKSSFINTIIERKNFARISSKPGRTQTLNFYLINDSFYLVDAPGYGYASVSKDTKQKFGKMIEAYLQDRSELQKVFMLIDYRHKPTEDDVLMYKYLRHYNNDVVIVATKFDKVKMAFREKQDKLIKETLGINDFIHFSKVTRRGKEEIYEMIKSSLSS